MVAEAVDLIRVGCVAKLPLQSRVARELLAAGLQDGDGAAIVGSDEASADVECGGALDAAVLNGGELGGAAADVDVKDAGALLAGDGDSAGAVGSEEGLEVVAGSGADEVASLGGEDVGNGGGRCHGGWLRR